MKQIERKVPDLSNFINKWNLKLKTRIAMYKQ